MSPVAVRTFRTINTSLELNGPTLSITEEPSDVTVVANTGDPTFGSVGMATASFNYDGDWTQSSTLSYQWYQVSGSNLTAMVDVTRSNGTVVAGSATSVLSFTNVTYGMDNESQYKCRVTTNPSAYDGDWTQYEAGTPKAWNDPLDTDIVTLTVTPALSISGQPADVEDGTPESRSLFNVIVECDNISLLSTVTYQWYLDGTALTNSSTVSGATSSQLSLTAAVGDHTVYCVVGHTSANPTSITSDTATYTVQQLNILNMEIVDAGGVGSGNVYYSPKVDKANNWNLADNPLNLSGQPVQTMGHDSTRGAGKNIFVWAPEKDVDVMIELAGAAGGNRPGSSGGQGGWGVFKMTLKQNQEYTFKLGSKDNTYGPGGVGIDGSLVTCAVGGGAAIMYKGNRVIALAGGGGGAGDAGGGGDGGGLNQNGESGFGRFGGEGGGTTGAVGNAKFTPSRSGGTIYGCPEVTGEGYPGDYCSNYTSAGPVITNNDGKYRIYNGTLQDVSNRWPGRGEQMFPLTASIARGFRSGNGGRWNGGWGINGQGGAGGTGYQGGYGSQANGYGGGGASGFALLGLDPTDTLTNGLEILRARSGVNTGHSYAIIHVLDENNIPDKTAVTDPSVQTLQWNDTRALGCKYGWGGTGDQSNPGSNILGPTGSLSDPRGKNWIGEWSNNARFTYQCSGSDNNIGYFIFRLYLRRLAPTYYNNDGSISTQFLRANPGSPTGANGARVRKIIAPAGDTEQERRNWIRPNTLGRVYNSDGTYSVQNLDWTYTGTDRENRDNRYTPSVSEAFRPFRIEFEIEVTFSGTAAPGGAYNRLVYTKNVEFTSWGQVQDVEFSSGQLGSANGLGGSDRLELPYRDLAYVEGSTQSLGYRGISLAGIRSNVVNLDGDGNSGWNTTQALLQSNGGGPNRNLSESDRKSGNGVEFGRTFKG